MENQNQYQSQGRQQAPAPNQGQMQNQYQGQGQHQHQNYQSNYNVVKNQSVVSIGDWIITIILMAIPFINLIMLFVWAFGNGTPESKANWAKATLIFYLIGIILVVLFWGSIAAMVGMASMGR
jgi:succinate dehydrogenase/fumarate reductase cytochrome b subunit